MPGGIPGGVGRTRLDFTSALVLAVPRPHRPETAEALVVERTGTTVLDYLHPGMGRELQRT